MTPSVIILIAASAGLIVNTLAVLGVAWKGGHVLGQMQESLRAFTGDVEQFGRQLGELGVQTIENSETIARTTAHLDQLDKRVGRLETQQDRA